MRTLRPTLGRGVCPGSTPSLDRSPRGTPSNDGAKIDPVLRLGALCVRWAPGRRASFRAALPSGSAKPSVPLGARVRFPPGTDPGFVPGAGRGQLAAVKLGCTPDDSLWKFFTESLILAQDERWRRA